MPDAAPPGYKSLGKNYFLAKGIPYLSSLPKDGRTARAVIRQKIRESEDTWTHPQVAVRHFDPEQSGFTPTRLAIPLPGESIGSVSWRSGQLHAHRMGPVHLIHRDAHKARGMEVLRHAISDAPQALWNRFLSGSPPPVLPKTAAVQELEKAAKAMFAPGIPASRAIKKIPTVRAPKQLEYGLHHHFSSGAAREHYDLRIGDRGTGQAHSWAMKYYPKPGETRLAVQQPTHDVAYMDFRGQIRRGYGAGHVELARRDKADVLHSDDDNVRFNVYPGKHVESYLLRRTKPGSTSWIFKNLTPTRDIGRGKLLPSSKPAYKDIKPDKLDLSDDTELQAKIDGAHVLYSFGAKGSSPRVFSYRPTERATGVIEHTYRLPGHHKRTSPAALGDTILRGELYATDDSGRALPAARIGGLLNSNVWKSREQQEQEGKLVPVAFDVVRWRGKDVSDVPYSQKREMLEQAIKAAPWLKKPRTASTLAQKKKLIEDIRSGKEPSTEEGVIEWHKDRPVPRKAKFLQERDVVIRNIFAERGQRDLAGGFEFSYTKNGPIIGRVGTGMSHAMKRDMNLNPSKYEGLTAKINVQRAPTHYAPRAPSFGGFHLDQDLPEGIKTAEKVPAVKKLEQAAKSFMKLKKRSPVPVTVEPKDPLLKRTGGAYYHTGDRRIVLSDKDVDALAHEVGHAEFDRSIPGYVLQSRLARGVGHVSSIGALAAGASGIKPSLGLGIPLVAQIPTLASEAVASIKGHTLRKELGATPEELDEYKRNMRRAYLTYASSVPQAAASYAIGRLLRHTVTAPPL